MATASTLKGNSDYRQSSSQKPLKGTHPRQRAKRARSVSPDGSPPSPTFTYNTRSGTSTAEDFRKLCQNLGFQEDFPDDILSMPKQVRSHQTREEWILQLMHEKYDEKLSENDSITSLTFESLAAVGFTYDKIQDILDRIPQDLRPYQETIYWAQQIVRDELFHLQNECPIYPFKDTPLNQLTPWPARNPNENPVPYGLKYANLDEFSRGSRSVGRHIKTLVGLPRARPGEMILYHATSHDSVNHILDHGIDLEAGKKPRDFSNGYSFYLDSDVDSCYDFASHIISAKAVMVYHMNAGNFTANMLDLLNFDENMDLWREVVISHRKPAGVSNAVRKLQQRFGLPRPYRDYDVVFGPWCKNIDEVTRRMNPQLPKPNENQLQYMVQNQTLADTLHQSLKYILFFPKK